MTGFEICLIILLIIDFTIIYLLEKSWKKIILEKKELTEKLEKAETKVKWGTVKIAELLENNEKNVTEFNKQINSHTEENQENADKYDEALQEKNKEYKKALSIINENASNQRVLFEEEIEELKEKLHKEQVDSNNKMYWREKWKAKFETLTNTIETQNNAKHILKKYKHNWAQIIEAYNKNK